MATKTKKRTTKTTKAAKATKATMSKKTTSKKSSQKKSTSKKTAASNVKAAKLAKPTRVSAIDAAAQVLKTTGKPMRAQELITAMAEQKLWTSPGGKTPHATLYAAILREINTKGTAARFTKIERGQFAFNAKAKG
jgi:hypothetical protein